jgi:hypothetical protein
MPAIVTFRTAHLGVAFALWFATVSCSAAAFADPSDLCVAAARDAAEQTEVPLDVLLAITLIETGQSRDGEVKPWPWAINAGGDSHWFDTSAEAETHVQDLLERGATNVDLGCFQLNYRWHAQNFASIADMLDPERNATYAARYLMGLQERTGDWGSAAAGYHSSTPEYAERYRLKFDKAYAALGGREVLLAEAEIEDATNGFPLLIAGRSGQFGSLVPASDGALPLFGSP